MAERESESKLLSPSPSRYLDINQGYTEGSLDLRRVCCFHMNMIRTVCQKSFLFFIQNFSSSIIYIYNMSMF